MAFRQGLNETGFVEGQNVAVEQRWADNHPDRLPALALDLVRRQVAVIACNGDAAAAAKSVTATIPIVFATGEDPVRQGLVTNLGRPDSNLTGVTFFSGGVLGEKRMELLHDLVPKAALVAVLADPNYGGAEADLQGAEAAGRVLGKQIMVEKAAGQGEFEAAFAKFRRRVPAHCWSPVAQFSPANVRRSSRWLRAMRCPRSIRIANTSRPAA